MISAAAATTANQTGKEEPSARSGPAAGRLPTDAELLHCGGFAFPNRLGLFKCPAADQDRMGVAHNHPVGLSVRLQTSAVDLFPLDRLPLTDPMKAAVRSTIPYHVTDVVGIQENRAYRSIGPLAAVDVRPRLSSRRGDACGVQGVRDRRESLSFLSVHLEDAPHDGHPLGIAEHELGPVPLRDTE